MIRDQLLEWVNGWVRRGWLRPIDRAFMDFLAELDPQTDSLVLLAAVLASHQSGRGHICLDLAAVCAAPEETLALPPEGDFKGGLNDEPSRLLAQWDGADWCARLASSPLVAAGPGNSPLVLAGHRLYLRRYWHYEQQVAQGISIRLQRRPPLPGDLAERLQALFPPHRGGGAPDWQKIACALAARGAFTVITGGPGTGKTTTVARLLALLQGAAEQAGQRLRIRLAAPTGKAAARLTESIGKAIDQLPESVRGAIPTEASTLHKLLGARPGTRRLGHDADNPLHADLVVIDEASMIDLEMMAALLNALRPETRLVLLGDKDQLASVEAGSVLGDLCVDAEVPGYDSDTAAWLSSAVNETVGFSPDVGVGGELRRQVAMLRVSRRFRADSGIGRLALAVNAGNRDAVAEVWASQPGYSDILRISLRGPDDEALDRLVLEGTGGVEPGLGYRHYLEMIRDRRPPAGAGPQQYHEWAEAVLEAFDRFCVLCALRRGVWGVELLNERIAEVFQRRGLIAQTHGWYEGRPVMVTRNDYGLGLMNGDVGIALRVPAGSAEALRLRVVFRLAGGGIKQVLPSRLGDSETVYAMTVHKSQGSEFDHVALVLPEAVSPILTRELVYTGITRAKRRFSFLASDFTVLERAIARRVQRSGGLAELLTQPE